MVGTQKKICLDVLFWELQWWFTWCLDTTWEGKKEVRGRKGVNGLGVPSLEDADKVHFLSLCSKKSQTAGSSKLHESVRMFEWFYISCKIRGTNMVCPRFLFTLFWGFPMNTWSFPFTSAIWVSTAEPDEKSYCIIYFKAIVFLYFKPLQLI